MRRVQVVPLGKFRLYGAMVAKEAELSRKEVGTFRRSGRSAKARAKWTHIRFPGWIKLARGTDEVVAIQLRSTQRGADWQLLRAILGFVDRHFGDKIQAINIQYTG